MYKIMNMEVIDEGPNILCKYESSELISIDEFTLIKGLQGSGKSRFAMNLVAGLAGYKGMSGFEFIEFPKDKHILIFSTEMSDRALRNRAIGIKSAIGNLDRIHIINTIEDGANIDLLEELVSQYDTHVVVIDHILDFIVDMNNIEASTKLCTRISTIAKKYNCAVIGIIHQNPDSKSGSKAGGHIGSMLERKAIAAFAVEKKISPGNASKSHHLISLTKIREGDTHSWIGDPNRSYGFFNIRKSINEIVKDDSLFDQIIFDVNISNIRDQIGLITGLKSIDSRRKIIEKWIASGLVYEEKVGNQTIIKKMINEAD